MQRDVGISAIRQLISIMLHNFRCSLRHEKFGISHTFEVDIELSIFA